MEKFFAYLLAVNLLLLLHTGYFRLFLARQRRFQWNRIYLLAGLPLALLLPLLRWEVVPPSLPNPSVIALLPEIVIGVPEAAPQAISAAETWSMWDWGMAAYLMGVGIALAVFAVRNARILLLVRRGRRTPQDGYTLVTTGSGLGPASYFRYIFWDAHSTLDPQCAAVALAHERCHSRQLHSLDLMAVELCKAFCWFNPAVYLLRRDLRQTHEFLADEAALQVAGPEGIKRLLLARQLGAHLPLITHHFYAHLKARIMILTEKSARKSRLQYLLVLPLAAVMVACTSLAHPAESTPVTAVSMVADSPTTAVTKVSQEEYQSYFDLEDIFIRSGLPAPDGHKSDKGIVCLGRQPQVLNLDTVMAIEELENVDNHPYLMNRDRVMKMIGYPAEAKERGIKGKVLVKLLVDETGRVSRYIFINDADAILRDAVEKHVKELLFKPGLENGAPAEWWVIMPFNFGMPGC